MLQHFSPLINIVIGLCLGYFLSYLQEKAKNKATQQDIKGITQSIEEVKSDLAILTHKKITLSSEKAKSLLEYYKKLNKWINYIIYLHLYDHSENPELHFLRVQENLEKLYYNFLSADAKTDVYFVTDYELLKAKNNIIQPAMKLSAIALQYLLKARTEATVFQLILSSPDTTPDNSKKQQKLFESGEKQTSLLKEFEVERKQSMHSVFELNRELIEVINNRIMDLMT